MNSPKFEEFLNKVTSKVKSKEAHIMIKNELTNHLQELSQSFQNRESSKEEAEDKAIQEMGSPFSLGEKLNSIHKPKMDWVLIVLFVIIAGISFLPLVGGVPDLYLSGLYFMSRQGIFYGLAVLVIIGFLFFDYRKLKNWSFYIYGGALFLLLHTIVFGVMNNGTQRLILIGDTYVDTTMITLFLFFLAWAGIFNRINEFNSNKKQIILTLLFWIPIVLYAMLPHVMLYINYFFCIITMFVFSNIKKKLMIKAFVANVVAGIILTVLMIVSSQRSYVYDRLSAYLNPESDSGGAGHIYVVAKDTFSQAGWFGNGLFNSNHMLPDLHTDFAFLNLVYSLGWLFGIVLCIILLLFILRISKNAFKTKDHYGRLLVIGAAVLVGFPTIWNILMGFGIVPIMGVSLPFISYGGSMIIFYSAILGLVLNVYRRKDIVKPTVVSHS